MIVILLILCLFLFLGFVVAIFFAKETRDYNKDIDEKNKLLQELNEDLSKKQVELATAITIKAQELDDLEQSIIDKSSIVKTTYENQKEMSQKAFENYCQLLEKEYDEKEEEYDRYEDTLKTSYSNMQLELLRETNKLEEELNKIKATRAAAIQAQLREKEIKEQASFYCLTIKDADLDDIKLLEKIKPQLHAPRILSMLIWSTYFQKPMTALCNNVVGTDTKCGIYKITNQLDNLCYIGQSVNISDRWKQHAKCGLGIDTPANNKLYKAMMEDGLWNFSFEILETCSKEELNEKEKYYIQLYQSYEYGYNLNTGIGKKG